MQVSSHKPQSTTRQTRDSGAAMEQDVAAIKSNDTKAYITKARNSIIVWALSAILLAQLLPPLLTRFGL